MSCTNCRKAWRCTFACMEMNELFQQMDDGMPKGITEQRQSHPSRPREDRRYS